MFTLRKLKEYFRRDDYSCIKVYVSNGGSISVRVSELMRNPYWRAKLKELMDADLTNVQRR